MGTVKPRCPKCSGALFPVHTITGVIDHIKCINCGWAEFANFATRPPTAEELGRYPQQGIAKSRRATCSENY